MKRAAGVVISALVFGLVAGASMVGVNVAAHKAGISSGVSSTLKEKRAESSPLEKKEMMRQSRRSRLRCRRSHPEGRR